MCLLKFWLQAFYNYPTVAIVQEPCILAMIRVSAQCNEISSDVRDVIKDISRTASRVVQTVGFFLISVSQIVIPPSALRTIYRVF